MSDVLKPHPHKIPESVLVVIHTPALDVLMLERADRPGFWQCVTGSKDQLDEPLSDTACREVLEETGIEVAALPPQALKDWGLANVYEIYPVWRHRYAPGVTHNTEHVFGLCVPAGTPVTLAPREHLQYRWLPWREAADLCFSPSNAEAILQLPAHLGDGQPIGDATDAGDAHSGSSDLPAENAPALAGAATPAPPATRSATAPGAAR